jgi:hypothetical protein
VIFKVALDVAIPLIPDEELSVCPFRVKTKSVF